MHRRLTILPRASSIHTRCLFTCLALLLAVACSREPSHAPIENPQVTDADGTARCDGANCGGDNNGATPSGKDASNTTCTGDACGADDDASTSCVQTGTCEDDRPSTCGDGTCDATDHCDPCERDCGACAEPSPDVTRGSYLQSGSSTSIVVKWRTSVESDSVVAYGPAPDDLKWVVKDEGATTRHEVEITGLQPSTKYYYAFGASNAQLVGGDEKHYFITYPPPGEAKPTRIWVIGDSGRPGDDQRAVRDAYLKFTEGRETDLWLMLGDNAYSDGRDDEHQEAVFDEGAYADILKRLVVWPTIGNHERVDEDGDSAPYFEIFTLPTQGEAGGLASGTEYYYSFDYGDIHIVCLDSDTHDESEAAQTWLRNDLEANDKKWLIAFWHHPPYSNGSHNSDDEGTLRDMRENFLPILEEYGVDLVFTGHSHSYERSVLLYGHYGSSDELADRPELILAKDGAEKADGDPMGDGAYTKIEAQNCPDIGRPLVEGANCGTVHAVVGSSSKVSDSDFPERYDGGPLHPAMVTFQKKLGSLVVDIDGDQADVVFLNSGDGGEGTADYTITDRFRLVK